MIDFKTFLQSKPNESESAFVALAAFGKHPGWYDHIDSLGEMTASLMMARSALYTDGIGRVIDSGVWEELESSAEGEAVPELRHTFLWQRGNQCIVGKWWPSRDKAGRARYPMIIAAHTSGIPITAIWEQVLPVLDEVEQACLEHKEADSVTDAVLQANGKLKAWASQRFSKAEESILPEYAPKHLDDFLRDEQQTETQRKLLWGVEAHLASGAPQKRKRSFSAADESAGQIRLPGTGASGGTHEVLLEWLWFLRTQLDGEAPVLLLAPQAHEWCDAVVGKPSSDLLAALRHLAPSVVEAEAEIESAFEARAQTVMDSLTGKVFGPPQSIFSSGKATTKKKAPVAKAKAQASTPAFSDTDSEKKGGLPLWIPAAAGAAILLLGGIIFFASGDSDSDPIVEAEIVANEEPKSVNTFSAESVAEPEVSAVAPQKIEPVKPKAKPAVAARPKPAPVKKNKPVKLADEKPWKAYYAEWNQWLGTLRSEVNRTHADAWSEHPTLSAWVEPLSGSQFEPLYVLDYEKKENVNQKWLLQNLPNSTFAKPVVVARIAETRESIEQLKATLQGLPEQEYLRLQQDALAAWAHADILAELAQQTPPLTWDKQIASRVQSIVSYTAQLQKTKRVVKELQENSDALSWTQSPQLASAWDIFKDELKQCSTQEAVVEQATEATGYIRELDTFLKKVWPDSVDQVALADALRRTRLASGRPGIEGWKNLVQSSRFVEPEQDPRKGKAWQVYLAEVEKVLSLLQAGGGRSFQDLSQELTRLQNEGTRLVAVSLTQGRLAQVQAEVVALEKAQQVLKRQANQALAREVEGFVKAVREQRFADAAIQKYWEGARQPMLLLARKVGDSGAQAVKFQEQREALGQTLFFLKQFAQWDGLPPILLPQKAGVHSAFYKDLKAYYALQREAWVTGFIPASVPAEFGEYVASASVVVRNEKMESELIQPLHDLGTRYTQIVQYPFWDDTLQTAVATVRKNRLHAPLLQAPAFQKAHTQLTNLEKLSQWPLERGDGLFDFAADKQRVLRERLTAWERLAAANWTPQVLADLTRARNTVTELLGYVGQQKVASASAAERTQLLNTSLQQIWLRYAERSRAHQLASMFEGMPDFGLTVKQLSPLLQLKHFVLQKQRELVKQQYSSLIEHRLEVIAGIKPFADKISNSSLQRLLAEIELLDPESRVGVEDLEGLGPTAIGAWDIEVGDEGSSVVLTYRSNPALSLPFYLVSSRGQPYYLSSEEVSAGVFWGLLQAFPSKIQSSAKLKSWYERVTRASGKPTLTPTWRANNGRVEVINALGPMHHLPGGVAAAFCEMLNCRLPTLRNWEELQKLYFPGNYGDYTPWNIGEQVNKPTRAQSEVSAFYWTPPRRQAAERHALMPVGQLTSESVRNIPFKHLLGNVAEFYQEGSANFYYVAGDSAHSRAAINPFQSYNYDELTAPSGFADVGFRMVFTAPNFVPYSVKLQQRLEQLLQLSR